MPREPLRQSAAKPANATRIDSPAQASAPKKVVSAGFTSRKPNRTLESYLMMENRFKMLTKTNPANARELFKTAQGEVDQRFAMYEYLASRKAEAAAAPPHAASNAGGEEGSP